MPGETAHRSTFYMVEMDYPHRTAAERAAFDAFYQRHIDMLLTIPGFLTAQRFHCPGAIRAPFLALYRLAGPEVITSEAYTSKAGRMSVDPAFRINMTNWDRNLVQSADANPPPDLEVPKDGTLTLIDRLTDAAPPLPSGFSALAVIGLDRTVAERGARVGAGAGKTVEAEDGWEVRAWRPIHEIRKPV